MTNGIIKDIKVVRSNEGRIVKEGIDGYTAVSGAIERRDVGAIEDWIVQ